MKKVLIIIISFLCIFSVNTVNAEVYTKERTPDNNYGVNKDIKITSSNLENIKNTAYVDANEKIYDFADILTDSEELTLRVRARNFCSKNNIDLVILTISVDYQDDYEHDIIASDFYDYNDFGMKYKHDSGILLIRNAYPGKEFYQMFTYGDAQLYYSSYAMESILDNIWGNIKNRNYYSAFNKFIEESGRKIDKNNNKDYYVNGNRDIIRLFRPNLYFSLILSALITTVIISILVNRNKLVKMPSKADEYLDMSSIHYNERTDKFKNSITTSYSRSSSYSSGTGHSSGGHSSSRSFSGGGHHSSGSSGRSHSSSSGRHG